MTDIHSHPIPFVDDGSPSWEESLRMLQEEVANGVDKLVCTPHHHVTDKFLKTPSEIRVQFELLKQKAKEANLPIELYLGQEIYFNTYEDVFGMLQRGELLTMNGSDRILIEFSPFMKPLNLQDIIYNCIVKGYQPIIAHIERYAWMDYDLALSAKQEGAFIQVNAGSVVGKSGLLRGMLVNRLIKDGIVDFIAGDAHSFRPPMMAEALKKTKRPDLFECDFV